MHSAPSSLALKNSKRGSMQLSIILSAPNTCSKSWEIRTRSYKKVSFKLMDLHQVAEVAKWRLVSEGPAMVAKSLRRKRSHIGRMTTTPTTSCPRTVDSTLNRRLSLRRSLGSLTPSRPHPCLPMLCPITSPLGSRSRPVMQTYTLNNRSRGFESLKVRQTTHRCSGQTSGRSRWSSAMEETIASAWKTSARTISDSDCLTQ